MVAADPWLGIVAAASRRTQSGRALGAGERVKLSTALDLYLGHPMGPGREARRVRAGASADLCLLDCPLREGLEAANADRVVLSMIGGELSYQRAN